MSSRIKSHGRMSNTGYHANGKPNWWARIGSTFPTISPIRGDDYLNVLVDVPVGTTVQIGAGKGLHKTIRETVVTVAE